MRSRLLELLKQCDYKGYYISTIKRESLLWDWILKITSAYDAIKEHITDKERIYLALNNNIVDLICPNKNYYRMGNIKQGFIFCDKWNKCVCAKEQQKQKTIATFEQNYGKGIINPGQLSITRKKHKDYVNSPKFKDAQLKAKQTNIERYGVENVFQASAVKTKIQETNLKKYNVINPSQSNLIKQKKIKTSLKNYGVEYPTQSNIIKEQTKETNIKKYGYEFATQNEIIRNKAKYTKQKTWHQYTNASKEATSYFIEYYQSRYRNDQICFNMKDIGLYEWGYHYKGSWLLFDFVAFEYGHRGNINKIIEIIEYMGPFHYTKEDVDNRGNERAFPWKTKNTTIKESFEKDDLKRQFCIDHNIKYTEIWPEIYHKDRK